jgi:hypothetical protein
VRWAGRINHSKLQSRTLKMTMMLSRVAKNLTQGFKYW